MTFSFSLDDLRKTLPGGESLDGLTGETLLGAVKSLLGSLAENAEVTLVGNVVTVEPQDIAESAAAEAARLQAKAAVRAKQGEFAKAEGIYRKVLELKSGGNEGAAGVGNGAGGDGSGRGCGGFAH